MIHLVQHVPGFVDGHEPNKADVETAADLENIEWIRSWKDNTGHVFYRWSWASTVPGGRGVLMAEYDQGDYFWVIAYAPAPIPGLPDWKETETARLRREKWNRGGRTVEEEERYQAKQRAYWADKMSPGDLFQADRWPGVLFMIQSADAGKISFESVSTGGLWCTPEEFAGLAPYCPIDGARKLSEEWERLNP